MDHTAWQMIENKRAEAGMKTLEAAGRPPRYIATAADARMHWAQMTRGKMQLVEVSSNVNWHATRSH